MNRPLQSGCLAMILIVAWGTGCSTLHTSREPSPTSGESTRSDQRQEPDSVLERRASAHAHYANGVVLEMENKRTRALEEFEEAARLGVQDDDLVWEVCRRFIAAHKLETAASLLKKAADQPNASGITWARLGVVEMQLGNSSEAVRASQRAIEREPGVLEGHQTLFLLHLQEGDFDQAQQTLEAAETCADSDPEFLIQLAELYGLLTTHKPSWRDSINSRVATLLDRAAQQPIEDPFLRLRLADALKAIGQNEKAANLYQDLLLTMPDVPGVRDRLRARLAEMYLGDDDKKHAAEQLEKLVETDPTNVRARYLLGHLAYEAGQLEKARDCFRQTLLLSPGFEQAYYDLASVLLGLDLVDTAEDVIAKARHKFPQSFSMEFLDALVHMRRKEYTAALGHFTAAEINAQALDPKRLNHFFYFQYGAAAEQAGDPAVAERELKKCLELKPDFAPAQNYLGYMWADRGEKLEEARTLIEKAVAAEPDNAAYQDSLAWVLFRLDRPQDALPVIRKAIAQLEEPDAVVYEHLGDILAALKQNGEAVEAWKKSYSLEAREVVKEKLAKAGYPVQDDRQPE